MPVRLKDLAQWASREASQRGFRSVGIYHLIWAVRKLDPDSLRAWLSVYAIEETHFVKMLENVMRPRRAGGGIPRDRREADLFEEAVAGAERLASARQETADASHLGSALRELSEDPVVVLCERYGLDFKAP